VLLAQRLTIVEFLQPKYSILENVPDIMRFVGGIYGRFVMSRFVSKRSLLVRALPL